jgi:hypothetical protein
MSARPITNELVQQVSEDRAERHDENIAFAQQFTAEHHDTFDRLRQ